MILYLRSILGVFFWFPLVNVVQGLRMVVLVKHRDFPELKVRIAKAWAQGFLRWFAVQVSVRGLENLPTTGAVLLYNHRSFVDIFALVEALPRFYFGAKAELFRIPFLGPAMSAFGAIPIERESRTSAIQAYENSKKQFARGEHILLAPEGTRNKSDETLLPFKSGPFVLAMEAGVPLVPVIIRGCEAVWPKGALLPGLRQKSFQVSVEILKPLEPPSLAERKEFKAQVFDLMKRELENK